MKVIYWVLLGILSVVFLLGMNILIIILANASWWWILISIIALILGWGTVGLVKLIGSLSKKPEVKTKVDVKDALKRIIKELKYDESDPDNFKPDGHVIARVGRPDKEPTPLLWVWGSGTETNKRITAIANLNNIKEEIIRVNDIGEKEVKEIIEKFAENPAEKIEEIITSTLDQFNRPTQTRRTISTAKAQEEKEKKEAEEKNAM